MTDAHRGAGVPPPRPPWEIELVGVRCPSCGLGGDVPDSAVRTVCPRCDTVFDVATSRAERPPDAPRPIALPPVPTAEPRPAPAAPPPPAAPIPRPIAPEPSPPTHRPSPPRSAPGRNATFGILLFVLGLLAGWGLFGRTDGDGDAARSALPADVRAATTVAGADGAPVDDGAAGSEGADDAGGGASDDRGATSTTGPGGAAHAGQPPDGAPTDGVTPPSTAPASPGVTVAPASPAAPSGASPPTSACTGLDCRMTAPSGVQGVPVPDDAVALETRGGATGWTTQVADVERLTAWYLDHLTAEGWVLNGPASVLDPSVGELRDLGHATSAVYCPSDSEDPIIAVNVGWPAGDESGDTVVLAVVSDIDESACD